MRHNTHEGVGSPFASCGEGTDANFPYVLAQIRARVIAPQLREQTLHSEWAWKECQIPLWMSDSGSDCIRKVGEPLRGL